MSGQPGVIDTHGILPITNASTDGAITPSMGELGLTETGRFWPDSLEEKPLVPLV